METVPTLPEYQSKAKQHARYNQSSPKSQQTSLLHRDYNLNTSIINTKTQLTTQSSNNL